jgi:hypothetical protein
LAAIVARHLLHSGKGKDEVIKERLCKCPVLFVTFSISSPPQSFQVWQIEMDKATAGNAFSTSGTASAVVDSGKAEVGTSENEIKDTNGYCVMYLLYGTASAVVDSGKVEVGASKNEIEDTNGYCVMYLCL